MPINPTKLTVQVNDTDTVTALLYPAAKKNRLGVTLILGHGAGANQSSGFMRHFANGLAERGIDVMTFNFVYSERGRGAPDPKAKLEACYKEVIEAAAKQKTLTGNKIAVGGKSMGGRIGSQVAAEMSGFVDSEGTNGKEVRSKKRAKKESVGFDIGALVFLGYPLHPPGRPDQLRDKHLQSLKAPMFFAQGTRDSFGTPDEFRAVIKRLHLLATLYLIEGGDHSFKVPRSAGVSQEQVYESTMDEIANWLKLKLLEK